MSDEILRAGWHQICDSLLAARRSRRWAATHSSFEDYAKRRWNLSKTRSKMFCRFSIFCAMCRQAKLPLPEAPDIVDKLLSKQQKRWLDLWGLILHHADGPVTPGHVDATLEKFSHGNKKPPPCVLDNINAKRAGKALSGITSLDNVSPENGLTPADFEKAAGLFERAANR